MKKRAEGILNEECCSQSDCKPSIESLMTSMESLNSQLCRSRALKQSFHKIYEMQSVY